MADSITSGGFFFPPLTGGSANNVVSTFSSQSITGSAGVLLIGRLYLAGAPAEKLFSSAGGKISFRSGASSVWTALSTLAIGLQDVDPDVGPPVRGDGVYDVSTTITSSTVAFPVTTWSTWTMTNGAKSLSHGGLYAIVVEMTNRVSTDAVSVAGLNGESAGGQIPCTVSLSSGTYATSLAVPNVLIECDDGTLGWFQGGFAISSISTVSISAGSANDEYGMRFVLPWTCQIDSLAARVQAANSAGDSTIILYSDPNGTPTTITSVAINGANLGGGGSPCFVNLPLKTNRTITASTTYMLAVLSAAASPTTINTYQFADATHKITYPGGGSLAMGARASAGAGAFSMVETNIPVGFHVRIHQIASSGATTITTTVTTTITLVSGMVVHPGMAGGFRG